MRVPRSRSVEYDPTFVAAIVGGMLGIGVTAGHAVSGGDGTSYPLAVVFVGSVLAGFLARRMGGKSRFAGVAAAVLSVVPMVLSVSAPVGYFIETYGGYGIGKATTTVALFVGFLLLVAVVAGSLGGVIGGWIETKFTARSGTGTGR